MKTLLNPEVKRDNWPPEMLLEPDKAQWVDKKTGLDCLAVRHPRGHHWCGYVGVPKGHPAYEVDENRVNADVHGGLTYSDKCQEREDGLGICHVPEPGRPHDIWWLGFDCAHSGDLSPAYAKPRELSGTPWETYRTLKYVQSECRKLAGQLVNPSIQNTTA